MTDNVAATRVVRWRRGSRSGSGPNGGNCVEVASAWDDTIAVRDSKLDTTGDFPVLTVPRTEWTGLLAELRQ